MKSRPILKRNEPCNGICNGKHCRNKQGHLRDYDDNRCYVNKSGRYCTLPIGHIGKHIACSEREHNIYSW